MKILPLALLTLFATTPVLAHPGHTAMVSGHTHSYLELGLLGGLLALVLLGYFTYVRRLNRG